MIRVCITGAGSYIGTNIALHLARKPEAFQVAELDVSRPWDRELLKGFDAVIHVAGIAHPKTAACTPPSTGIWRWRWLLRPKKPASGSLCSFPA